ncbi:Synaptogyrin-1, partial [Xenoophorus captivus]
LFSIVIFGCITNEGYINRPSEVEEYCIFNRNQNACNYGVFMGSMAFLCCVAFLALDVYFPQISSVKDRKKAVLADIGEYTDPSQDAAGAPYTSFGGGDLESPSGGGAQANSDGAFDGTGGYQRQDY